MAIAAKRVGKPRSKKTVYTRPLSSEISDNKICFVIMPFGGYFDDYYAAIYIPAIEEAGLKPHRADDLFRPSTITNDIWIYTHQARVMLADLSGKNPNVFYELGLAHALAKPVILITQSMDDIPFDLRALRVIVYDKNKPDWGDVLQQKIKISILETLSSPNSFILPAFLSVDPQSDRGPHISESEKQILELRSEIELLRNQMLSTMDSVRYRGPRGERISPADARERIALYLQRGMQPEDIIMRLRDLGVPSTFSRSRIDELTNREPDDELPDLPTLNKKSLI